MPKQEVKVVTAQSPVMHLHTLNIDFIDAKQKVEVNNPFRNDSAGGQAAAESPTFSRDTTGYINSLYVDMVFNKACQIRVNFLRSDGYYISTVLTIGSVSHELVLYSRGYTPPAHAETTFLVDIDILNSWMREGYSVHIRVFSEIDKYGLTLFRNDVYTTSEESVDNHQYTFSLLFPFKEPITSFNTLNSLLRQNGCINEYDSQTFNSELIYTTQKLGYTHLATYHTSLEVHNYYLLSSLSHSTITDLVI